MAPRASLTARRRPQTAYICAVEHQQHGQELDTSKDHRWAADVCVGDERRGTGFLIVR
jgi:hypothetical protein